MWQYHKLLMTALLRLYSLDILVTFDYSVQVAPSRLFVITAWVSLFPDHMDKMFSHVRRSQCSQHG